MNKTYEVQLEIAGPSAMWTRPDTGSAPVSAPVPSFSAAKGIFEAILYQKSVHIVPKKVEICSAIKFHKYHTNYGGPLRKAGQFKDGASYQLPATILSDVCYRIYAEIAASGHSDSGLNDRHIYQDRFNRRLRRGQWFHTPCLGWSEFIPNYVGEFRSGTKVVPYSTTIPSHLHSVFNSLSNGQVAPRFMRDFQIREGVAFYAE